MLLVADGAAVSVFTGVRGASSDVPMLADLDVCALGVRSEMFRLSAGLGGWPCLCCHEMMLGEEVIKPVIGCKGQVIGLGNLEVDGLVKLDDTYKFCWDGDGSEQSNNVFFVLTELFESVRIGE